MNWAMLLMMALAIVTVVAGSVLYGYALAIKHVKRAREQAIIVARLNRIKTNPNRSIRADDIFDVFDVD